MVPLFFQETEGETGSNRSSPLQSKEEGSKEEKREGSTSLCGLSLLVYEVFRYYVCVLELLVHEVLFKGEQRGVVHGRKEGGGSVCVCERD